MMIQKCFTLSYSEREESFFREPPPEDWIARKDDFLLIDVPMINRISGVSKGVECPQDKQEACKKLLGTKTSKL